MVASSSWDGEEGVVGGGLGLCLRAEISVAPWMVHSDVIEKIRIISCQNIIRTKKGGASSHLCLLSQLLFAMEERALVAADCNCVLFHNTDFVLMGQTIPLW